MRSWAKAVAIAVGLAVAIFLAMLLYDAWATRGTVGVHNGAYFAENVPYAPPAPPPCANGSKSVLSPLLSTSFHGVFFAFSYGTQCPSGDPALQAVGTESNGQVRVHTFVRPRLGNVWFSTDGAFGARIGSGVLTLYSRYSGFLFFPQLHLGAIPPLAVGGWRARRAAPASTVPGGGRAAPGPAAPRTRGAGFRGSPRSGWR